MDFVSGFFYFFSAVLLFAGFRVITARNPVHAVLYLMLAFSQAAALWLLLKAEFLGIALVLVYLGAVMVLFLFVVMMLDINVDALRAGFWKHLPLALVLGALVSVELIAVLWAGFPTATASPSVTGAMHAADHRNTYELGRLLYSEYLYPIQAAAVILLVAMIAAIALTLRRRKDTKTVDPGVQVRVKAADRLQVLNVPATRTAAPEAAKEEQA
ncbi:NADH-quinone oxidoreductase subunit J [Tepidimonas fonticaldi]|uniref:NADH-quinone oxidoreductase subunit J n=1 Tax=Tepidimonas fonticaldi TaxID=1101373 RepID=A0A1A6DV83_9BURK|nr:NADH-quinone oxidoreductase subunit J [Tepidimonas fonticaldi]OBS30591.1 NADH:ubiquinone oxidoreductase subunit J [Tepidimonas fonticaldi]TSE38022.1 NADH-quinone oxidoreductase subunit J [Tepidimonas fonticaldi]